MQNNFLKDWICLYYIQLCSPRLITQKRQWKWIVCIATIVILLMYDNLENIRMIDLAMIAKLVHVHVQVSLYKKCKLPRDDRLHLKRKKNNSLEFTAESHGQLSDQYETSTSSPTHLCENTPTHMCSSHMHSTLTCKS